MPAVVYLLWRTVQFHYTTGGEKIWGIRAGGCENNRLVEEESKDSRAHWPFIWMVWKTSTQITQDNGVKNNNEQVQNKNHHEQLKDDFKFYLNEVSSIIKKLEDLEKEKDNLKDQLKIYEQEFLNKRKNTEDKINSLTEECKILDKTINVIKNLKSF